MRHIRFIPALLVTLAAGPGFAEGAGKWRIGGGIQVERYSGITGHIGNYRITGENISDTVERGTLSIEYRPADHIGIGADFALPAPLSVRGDRAHINATISGMAAMGRYYFAARRNVRPFAGLGMLYSIYSKETLQNSPSRSQPDIENSLSPTFALGLEIHGKKREVIRAELGYHRSAPEVLVNDRDIGILNLHPVKLNFTYLTRF